MRAQRVEMRTSFLDRLKFSPQTQTLYPSLLPSLLLTLSKKTKIKHTLSQRESKSSGKQFKCLSVSLCINPLLSK
jgi:hypothetical protein